MCVKVVGDGAVGARRSIPTRHRVRLGDQVEVYAMCALDTLGMSALIAQDTRIDSVAIKTGQPITMSTCDGRTSWEPATAMVFLGTHSGVGPSAECCCDYLKFFVDRDAAHAWVSGHPLVPGQILDQAEAEDLGVRLFGNLLPPGGG